MSFISLRYVRGYMSCVLCEGGDTRGLISVRADTSVVIWEAVISTYFSYLTDLQYVLALLALLAIHTGIHSICT